MTAEALREKVEIRTWPERTDVVVVSSESAEAIGHFEILSSFEDDDPARPSGPLYDVAAGYELRSRAAIEAMSADQIHLGLCFETSCTVELLPDSAERDKQRAILDRFGIAAAMDSLAELPAVEPSLRSMAIDDLFALLCEWHDVVEQGAEAGISAAEPGSWAQRARPENAHLFAFLANGSRAAEDPGSDSQQRAYEMFCGLCDPSLRDFSLGAYLRWIYYHRTEFCNYVTPAAPRALLEAKVLLP